jgi:hypothetical protein
MKLTHIAQGLTLLLVLATVWLAWQASDEAKKANAKMDRLTAQATSMGTFPSGPASAASNEPSLLPAPTAALPVQPTAPPASASITPPIPVVETAGNTAPSSEPTAAELARAATPSAPAPALPPGELTALQKRVKDAPTLGKIQEFSPEYGFVAFQVVEDSGLKPGMKFDLRRDAAVVGRIAIDHIEGVNVIANLESKSVPAGVVVQKGDEIISVIPTPTAAVETAP